MANIHEREVEFLSQSRCANSTEEIGFGDRGQQKFGFPARQALLKIDIEHEQLRKQVRNGPWKTRAVRNVDVFEPPCETQFGRQFQFFAVEVDPDRGQVLHIKIVDFEQIRIVADLSAACEVEGRLNATHDPNADIAVKI